MSQQQNNKSRRSGRGSMDDTAAVPDAGGILHDLRLADLRVLGGFGAREVCPNCDKKYCRYCVQCLYLHPRIRHVLPPIRLPVKLDILKHAGERNTKSTALHAKVVCPDDVTVYSFPKEQPQYDDMRRVLLLFPGKEASRICDVDPSSYDRILVLDGSWSQARSMICHQEWLRKLRKVTMQPRQTIFWRYQNTRREDGTFLATIEGIYYLYREHWEAAHPGQPYNGEYDNLLYFYMHNYELIQKIYRENPGKKFSGRHCANYIKYDKMANIELTDQK